MSMSFNDPINKEALSVIDEIFGDDIVVKDDRTLLIDNFREIYQQDMKKIANAAKQPATVEIHGEGEIKTMADGTRYQVTPRGWKKLND